MPLVLELGISSLVLVISILVPLVAFFLPRKWSQAARRRDEIRRLLIHASEEEEEAARAELEASLEFSSISISNGFQCPVCYCPATTRCSQCKAVRYCSGKCQIIHWRQGHKDECRPACIIYNSNNEKIDSVDETLLLHHEPVTIPIIHEISSNPARSLENTNGDIADDLVDKEESVSVAETSGSSFSGFSSSPRNASGDEISLCESFSSSDSDIAESLHDAHVSFEVDDAPSKPLSPKFLHLVESVDSLANLTKFSLHKPGGIKESHSVAADASYVKSSDFWGLTLGSVKCVSENVDSSKSCGPSASSLHFSSGSSGDTSGVRVSEHTSTILEEALGDVLGTGNSSVEVNLKERGAEISNRSEISLSTSSYTNAPSPLDTTVTFQKSKEISSKSGCMLVPLNVGEAQLLASKVAKTSVCADFVKPSPLGAKFGRVLDHQKRNGVAFHCINSQHGKSSLKASVLKVEDLWTRLKSPAENEMAERHGHMGLFPYELFLKLYTDKAEFQPCGLMNCGNSCFANVVFQCLMFTPPLTTYFIQQFHSRACPNKEQCFTCGFENLVLKAREGKSPLSPNWLLSRLQNIGIFLGNGKQEDAHEFLRFVVDTMQSVCIKASEHDTSKTRKLEDTNLISLTFGGYLRSKIKCMKCQGKSERCEKMMDLTLEIDGDIRTLDDALRRFTSTEVLDGENKYICGRCKSYERAKKKLKIMEPPNVLTIALKRFQSGKFGKLNKLIRFPETLDLAPYVSGGTGKSHDYSLFGVIVHLDIMNAAFSGHYVCYIRNSQNKWFKADDSTVVTSEVEGILTKGAYMLFYARCSPMPPKLTFSRTEASNKKSCMPVPQTNELVSTSNAVWSSSGGQSGNIHSFYSSFQRLKRILENDSSSDSSSLFDSNSDECSCSTDSTSMDDFAEHQGRACGKSDGPCSPSPLFTNPCRVGNSARSSPKIYLPQDSNGQEKTPCR